MRYILRKKVALLASAQKQKLSSVFRHTNLQRYEPMYKVKKKA